MSLGSSFHSLGPAYINERSPNVIQLLKEGLLSKSISSELRLVSVLQVQIYKEE